MNRETDFEFILLLRKKYANAIKSPDVDTKTNTILKDVRGRTYIYVDIGI